MSLDACAALVARGDPDRWQALMAAPVQARADLLPLYAFNLELARIPWTTKEPMIAEMRLQWWREVVEAAIAGEPARAHEVAGPLNALIREKSLPFEAFDQMIEARRHDAWGGVFTSETAFYDYLGATGGGLMWLSALALGAGPAAEEAVRLYGRASAMAGYFRAVPELSARGRHPLPEAVPEVLAREGLEWLKAARAGRRSIPRAARAALLPGWQAGAILARASADPEAIAEGRLTLAEFGRRGGLLWQALSGRF
ncbi:squalene/phytoene synthase family protein [Rhodobacter sp. 24-YEA-8]|uniref:phytoene/squalene synthase family protein n=1 Tax=Rhodobacter sp. 24-YEA-8 TaxID=1884310 RepID=UPI0008955C33|nr:squalene/phytoene synthase family protein [Rhodobacter sp. 24-YEA-8]SEB82453.1 Phytoene/squalene synthetase [Rhodobacter sp. 24-YEA-8]